MALNLVLSVSHALFFFLWYVWLLVDVEIDRRHFIVKVVISDEGF